MEPEVRLRVSAVVESLAAKLAVVAELPRVDLPVPLQVVIARVRFVTVGARKPSGCRLGFWRRLV